MGFKNPIIGEDLKDIQKNTDFDTNQTQENIRHAELMCVLKEILVESKKTNMYYALITNTRI